MAAKSYVIALEEHYQDTELRQHSGGTIAERLEDVGALRLKDMDEAGIDIQVLSHADPAAECRSGPRVPLARRVNDRLTRSSRAADRFAAFAALPTSDPRAAADELARSVEARPQGRDDPRSRARAFHRRRALLADLRARRGARRADLCILDAAPGGDRCLLQGVRRKDFPVLLRAAWGFTVETATLAIRLVLSGVFDAIRT